MTLDARTHSALRSVLGRRERLAQFEKTLLEALLGARLLSFVGMVKARVF